MKDHGIFLRHVLQPADGEKKASVVKLWDLRFIFCLYISIVMNISISTAVGSMNISTNNI